MARHTSPKPEPCGKIGGQKGQQQKHAKPILNTSMSSKIVGSKVEVLKVKLDLKNVMVLQKFMQGSYCQIC